MLSVEGLSTQREGTTLPFMLGKVSMALVLLALAAPGWAGHVYRCQAADGGVSYVSKRVPGAQCKLVSSYRTQRARSARPAPAGASAVAVNLTSGVPPVAGVTATTAAPGGVPPVAGVTATTAVPAAAAVPVAAPTTTPAATGPRVVRGQVYSFIGADGVRNYTSVRPRGVPAMALRTIHYSYIQACYACGSLPGVNFGTLRLNTTAYDAEIRAAAAASGVEEAVVRAIIHAESAFNPLALSRAGAQGLMQLMPATARRFGVSDAFNAGQNIQGGVQYLAWLLKRYKGDLTLAAAGYNAGEGAVDRYGGVPPYSETQRYVQRVAILAQRYRGALAPATASTAGGLSAR